MKPIERKDIVYEDGNILVAFKGVGLLTDGAEKSLHSAVNAYLGQYNKEATPCHRLDHNTDGIVVFAKNKEAEAEMLDAFKTRTLEKYYLAEVKGVPKRQSAVLKAYLFKDSKKSVVYIYDTFKTGCVPIETHYKLIKPTTNGNSLIEVKLVSGKTHQIRAHLAHVGHPILGDGKYGDFALNRRLNIKCQQLTAYKLVFHFEKESLLFYLNDKTIELKT